MIAQQIQFNPENLVKYRLKAATVTGGSFDDLTKSDVESSGYATVAPSVCEKAESLNDVTKC